MAVVPFLIDPVQGTRLDFTPEGSLTGTFRGKRVSYLPKDGVLDFVTDPGRRSEREHYDKYYAKKKPRRVSIQACRDVWNDHRVPEHRFLLESLGPLAGKTLLLLGNGASVKELLFLEHGAKVVCTDLSLHSMQHLRTVFEMSEFHERELIDIDFYAVDALALPFPEDFFDIIYGYAFVHHVQDLQSLFSGLHRCMKPGGTCRFFDSAYSPVWHFAKTKPLRWLQRIVHLRIGISPEDRIASDKGGFQEEELESLMRDTGFHSLLFKRLSFFQHLGVQVCEKAIANIGFLRTLLSYLLAPLDHVCERHTSFIENNGVSLVWGFSK